MRGLVGDLEGCGIYNTIYKKLCVNWILGFSYFLVELNSSFRREIEKK